MIERGWKKSRLLKAWDPEVQESALEKAADGLLFPDGGKPVDYTPTLTEEEEAVEEKQADQSQCKLLYLFLLFFIHPHRNKHILNC